MRRSLLSKTARRVQASIEVPGQASQARQGSTLHSTHAWLWLQGRRAAPNAPGTHLDLCSYFLAISWSSCSSISFLRLAWFQMAVKAVQGRWVTRLQRILHDTTLSAS